MSPFGPLPPSVPPSLPPSPCDEHRVATMIGRRPARSCISLTDLLSRSGKVQWREAHNTPRLLGGTKLSRTFASRPTTQGPDRTRWTCQAVFQVGPARDSASTRPRFDSWWWWWWVSSRPAAVCHNNHLHHCPLFAWSKHPAKGKGQLTEAAEAEELTGELSSRYSIEREDN